MKPNAMLVTLTPSSSDFVTLQTYDPIHGRSQRFYVSRPDLTSLCTADMPLMDTDLNNYLIAYRHNEKISFKVAWLSINSQDEAAGYIQRFALPVSCCIDVLNGKPVCKVIALTDTRSKATIRFTPEGHQEIHRLCADRHTRRALCRFFRDNLNYGDDETINLTRDSWTGGFYFFSPDTGMEGGVILHETEVKGRDGKAHRKVFFGLHT